MTLAQAYLKIAAAFLEQGHCVKAGTWFRKVLEVEPDNFDAHNGLGAVFFVYSKLAEAAQCFKRAHDLQPDNHSVLANLAACFQRTGNYEIAMLMFLKALRDRPDAGWVYYDLSASFRALNRFEDARKAHEAACLAEPDNVGFSSGMIWMLDQDPDSTPEDGRRMRREWYARHRLPHLD